MFYVICKSQNDRLNLISHLKEKEIHAVFHYLSLHKSLYYGEIHGERELPQSDFYTEHLLRLPMYYELKEESIVKVINSIKEFYS